MTDLFALTEEHREIRAAVRAICEAKVAPYATAVDEEARVLTALVAEHGPSGTVVEVELQPVVGPFEVRTAPDVVGIIRGPEPDVAGPDDAPAHELLQALVDPPALLLVGDECEAKWLGRLAHAASVS